MRRHPQLVALILAASAAIAAAAVQVLPPLLTGALFADALSMAVGAALAASGAYLVVARERVPGVVLLTAAALWCSAGAAQHLPEPFAEIAARSVLVPHALLAIVLMLATPRASRRWVLLGPYASVALAAAVAGGTVGFRPALIVIGLALAASALIPWETVRSTAQLAGGLALATAAALVTVGALPGRLGSTALFLVLLTLAVVAPAMCTRDRMRRVDPIAGDSFEEALAAALRIPSARVLFPFEDGWVDLAGLASTVQPDASTQVGDPPIASILPRPKRMPPALVALLRESGAVAAARARQRRAADELRTSSELLASVAAAERSDLERRLVGEVVPLVDAVANRVRLPEIVARAEEVRDELLRIGGPTDGDEGAQLARMLDRLASAWDMRIHSSLESWPADAAHSRTAWFVAVEAVVNALKHSRGQRVTVETGGDFVVRVSDDGVGGANTAGAGLAGLAARAAESGGRLHVRSTARGTTVTFALHQGAVIPDLPADIPDAVLTLAS